MQITFSVHQRDHVHVHVRHFEPGDEQPDLVGRVHLLRGAGDGLGDMHDACEELGVEVDPVVDL